MSATLQENQDIFKAIEAFKKQLEGLCQEFSVDANIIVKHPFGNETAEIKVKGRMYSL